MAASMLSPVFVIGHIRIGSVEGASSVNLGNNRQHGFASRKTHNQGFGSVEGDGHTVRDARSFLGGGLRHEAADGSGSGGDPDVPAWIRKLIAESFRDSPSQ